MRDAYIKTRKNLFKKEFFVHHARTSGGCSGAPILDRNMKVIGVQSYGECCENAEKYAEPIEYIYDYVKQLEEAPKQYLANGSKIADEMPYPMSMDGIDSSPSYHMSSSDDSETQSSDEQQGSAMSSDEQETCSEEQELEMSSDEQEQEMETSSDLCEAND